MRMLFNLVITVAIIYLLLVLLVFLGQARLIYFPEPEREIVITPDQVGLSYEPVAITTTDGETLHGWFVPAQKTKATILFFHGNAGNISHRIEYLPMFHRLGYNTFIFDYRGYGQSSGLPSEVGTYLDAMAAWDYLIEVKKIMPSRIVLFGESLGGAVAAWLAAREKPGALVLASVFTSVPDLAEQIYPFLPVRLIARINYPTIDYLQSVTGPVLVAHSPQDEIVPFAHGQNLYRAASEPKQFLTLQGGHNNGFIFMRESWINALSTFVGESLDILP
ncbi:MAG: alpha/beta hydrolase [Nitrosomonas sp.]|nr:alpha/beta hydrolase [Nitrosomonas sp.]MDP1950709.1 alpha/beta hydrolase [Nitrosomonas sp.]